MTQVQLQQNGKTLTARLSGEIDHHWAGILRENRDKIVRNERLIALDRTLDTGALVPRRPSPALRERKTYEIIAAIGER